jgi:hypothetical protein
MPPLIGCLIKKHLVIFFTHESLGDVSDYSTNPTVEQLHKKTKVCGASL